MKRCGLVKLDHDSYAPRVPLRELKKRARRAGVAIREVVERRSPSGKGWHRVVTVEPAPAGAMETVALQLLMGSDPRREAYNIQRARLVDSGAVQGYWAENWNVLYSRPATVAGRSRRATSRR